MQLQLLFSVTVWVRRIKYFLSSWLIKKNDIWPFREGPFFFVGPANTKNGTGENSSKRDRISKSN